MTPCGLWKNESIPNRPYQTKFRQREVENTLQLSVPLNRYMAGGSYDHGNAISREDFPNGYSLISFDTSPDLCLESYSDPIYKGGLKLELQFGSALTQAVNFIAYAEFNNLIEINGNCHVIHNFAE